MRVLPSSSRNELPPISPTPPYPVSVAAPIRALHRPPPLSAFLERARRRPAGAPRPPPPPPAPPPAPVFAPLGGGRRGARGRVPAAAFAGFRAQVTAAVFST